MKDERKVEKNVQGQDRRAEDASQEKSRNGKGGDKKVPNRSKRKKDGDDIRAIPVTEKENTQKTKGDGKERKRPRNAYATKLLHATP